MTQQHISQIGQRQRPLPLEQRRRTVTELGIAADDLGLSAGHSRRLMLSDEVNPEITISQQRWRSE